ncbi:hypothetical protein [Amycolatopsis sp. CA-230715]|uniref:hypothetical protein n=1 Tax=Amycolatopsis sp. CA-230715 TaxID=2745196 RepID=UPI001C32FEA7|nr:hypothetical protein [Amycolatopsis sp. CA-230715]QWF77277.1 hypothetical protein HUW46_00667 [Amycolatopsis sp. CA-230715]
MPQSGSLRRRSLLSATTAVTALGALTLAAAPASAAETRVPCDAAALVAAVTAANASSEPDTLSLAPNCVYTLTSAADTRWATGLPPITGKLTINGNHATIARAKSAPQFRIIFNRSDLTLNEITITGGHAPDGVGVDSYGKANPGEPGGGIENWGPLTISNSAITDNTAGAGAPGTDGTAAAPRAGDGGRGGFGGGISSYDSGSVPLTITGSSVTGNTTGVGGRAGNSMGTAPGGQGGTGGFGGGIDVTAGTALRITGSTITGNSAADGTPGGSGGPEGGGGGDGGSGGSGAGVFYSSDEGKPLNPVVVDTKISGNRAGKGGDAGVSGPGGYAGWPGYGGRGGGLDVFYDLLTLDGGTVTDNVAGEPGSGPNPLPASGGGIATLRARVALTNGAVVSGNRPDNCDSVADVPGCVNGQRALGVQRTREAFALDRQAADVAAAAQAAFSAMSAR